MSVGTDNLSPNLPQRRNLLFRQGGVEGVGKKKIIAVEGSAAGTEGAQGAGLGCNGMAGAPLGAGTGGSVSYVPIMPLTAFILMITFTPLLPRILMPTVMPQAAAPSRWPIGGGKM